MAANGRVAGERRRRRQRAVRGGSRNELTNRRVRSPSTPRRVRGRRRIKLTASSPAAVDLYAAPQYDTVSRGVVAQKHNWIGREEEIGIGRFVSGSSLALPDDP
uniref:Uncharacterized protein n=1 Tax=Plectus sambesii TaxID=2011161 RepID=A0A914W5S8_9BILA